NLLEKLHECERVITCCVLVLESEKVSLPLRIAAEFQERHGHTDCNDLTDRVPGPSAYKNERKGDRVPDLPLRHIPGRMASGHVCDLMCHHARQFRLVVGRQNQPRVHVEVPAWQSKSVDFVVVDDFD